tara:strand:- start:165 stop:347 length:183 start_codon:yes stop_codon:yes gene_type:complete
MNKDKQKINQLEGLLDSIMEALEENISTYFLMIEKDSYEYYKRDYEHYKKENELNKRRNK